MPLRVSVSKDLANGRSRAERPVPKGQMRLRVLLVPVLIGMLSSCFSSFAQMATAMTARDARSFREHVDEVLDGSRRVLGGASWRDEEVAGIAGRVSTSLVIQPPGRPEAQARRLSGTAHRGIKSMNLVELSPTRVCFRIEEDLGPSYGFFDTLQALKAYEEEALRWHVEAWPSTESMTRAVLDGPGIPGQVESATMDITKEEVLRSQDEINAGVRRSFVEVARLIACAEVPVAPDSRFITVTRRAIADHNVSDGTAALFVFVVCDRDEECRLK